MKRVIRRYELTDEEWERLRKYFPERQPGTLGRPRKDSRDMLNGIFWIARSGAAWRDLPERYGPWQTVYKRFAEWQKSGLIEKIFHELGEDADLEDISIDSTYIKAHKASAGAERGGRKIAKRLTQSFVFGIINKLKAMLGQFRPCNDVGYSNERNCRRL